MLTCDIMTSDVGMVIDVGRGPMIHHNPVCHTNACRLLHFSVYPWGPPGCSWCGVASFEMDLEPHLATNIFESFT